MNKYGVKLVCSLIPNKIKREKVRSVLLSSNNENNCLKIQTVPGESIIFLQTITNNKDPLIFNNNIYIFQNNFIVQGTQIGRFSYIGEYSKVDLGVTIGKYCSIANNVLIGATIHPQNWLSTSPFQYDNWLSPDTPKRSWQIYKNTVIGNDVWIGAHAIIQSGIKIGDGAIIGSGTIVTKDVPSYAIVVGSPAKILKYRFNDDIIAKLSKLQWWNLPHEKIVELDFENVEKVIEGLSK